LAKKKMQISFLLIRKLKEFEGLRLEAYQDAAGVWTIGYGHTGKDVRKGDRISEYWATDLLMRDLQRFIEAVDELNVARTQGQFDALVSFAFNLGIGRLKSSTLLKVIREGGSRAQIRREFKRWVYAGGRRLKGLERRREWEAKRFFE
jgi:lysozyme